MKTTTQVEQIDAKEAAKILEVKPGTLRGYVKRGQLNPIRRNARWLRYRKSEVVKLRDEGCKLA